MNKIRSEKNGVKAVFIGLFVLLSTFGPMINVASAAAAFNQGSQPLPLLSGANGSENGTTNWEENSFNVEIGEGMSLMVYIKNTSSDTADDTKISIDIDIDSDGEGAQATAKVWADNASTKSDSININLVGGGEITDIVYTESQYYDADGEISFPGDKSDVVTSGGADGGDIDPDEIRYFVVDFAVEGDEGGSNNNDEPQVETRSATNIDEDSARLSCRIENGDEDAEVWFEWGEDDDDLDEDTSKVNVDANDTETIYKTITGLDEDTRYYFRCFAEDDDGNEDRGSIRNFRTDGGGSNASDPDVVTLSATGVTSASATLRGEVDPNGDDTDAWFEWGTSSSNLNRTTSKQDVGDGSSDVAFSSFISGLSANTTYYFRAMAESGEGDDRGNILSFRTGTITTNIITRFIDVVREVETVEPEPEALIITLNVDSVNVDDRTVEYVVSYDNRTRLYLTDAELTVYLSNELNFVDSSPNPSRDLGDQLIYNIGRIEAGEQGSFFIETELDSNVDRNDILEVVAHVEYNDDGSVRKIVEVIDEHTFGELVSGGSFTATFIDAFRGLFTNALFWIILFILLVFFGVRYMLATRDRKADTLV